MTAPPDKTLAALVDPGLPPDVLTLNHLAVREVELATRLHDSLVRLADQLPAVEGNAKLCLAVAKTMKEVTAVQATVTRRVQSLLQASAGLRLVRGFRIDTSEVSE